MAEKSTKGESKKAAVAARRALQVRIERAVVELVAAAEVELATDEARHAQYLALIPRSSPPKKKPASQPAPS